MKTFKFRLWLRPEADLDMESALTVSIVANTKTEAENHLILPIGNAIFSGTYCEVPR